MKNKIFVLLVFCLMLCGCGNYRELNDLSVITGVAIDKDESGYKLSYLIANSQKAQTSSKEGEAQTTVYSGTGKNLTEAVKAIEVKSPKQLYYGHITTVIISEEIGKEGFLKVSDIILRNPETRKQFYILQAKDCEAKDILKIVSPLESFPSQNIASLIKANQLNQSFSSDINYSQFIGQILDKGYDAILPTITVKGDIDDGSKEKNIQTTEPKTYLRLGALAIYHNDKFIDYASKTESQDINILKNKINEFKYNFKYNDDLVAYTSDNVKTKINLKSSNEIEINVTSRGFISEINQNVDLENLKTLQDMENKLSTEVEDCLKKTLNSLQHKYKADVIGFGNKIYKKYPNEWKKVEDKWNEKYFPRLNIKVKANFKIESTGSLDRTIEEVNS